MRRQPLQERAQRHANGVPRVVLHVADAADRGIRVLPPGDLALASGRAADTLGFGFGMIRAGRIEPGLRRLAMLLR